MQTLCLLLSGGFYCSAIGHSDKFIYWEAAKTSCLASTVHEFPTTQKVRPNSRTYALFYDFFKNE